MDRELPEMKAMRWPIILRVKAWRRVLILAIVLLLMSMILAWPLARSPGERATTIAHAEVGVRVSGQSILESTVSASHRATWPLNEVVVVHYEGVTTPNQSVMEGGRFSVDRRVITYWSSHVVVLPDGRRLEPEHDDAVIYMTAADTAFESTLPPHTSFFLWQGGLKTWRGIRNERDYVPAARAALVVVWIVLLGVCVVLSIAFALRERMAHLRIRNQRCWRCGYDRSGIAEVACPECAEENIELLKPRRLPLASHRRRSDTSSPPLR